MVGNICRTVNPPRTFDVPPLNVPVPVVNEFELSTDDTPLVIPEEAVVVAGSRSIQSGIGKEWGISLYTPIIVKYRDSKTESKIQLEDVLRG